MSHLWDVCGSTWTSVEFGEGRGGAISGHSGELMSYVCFIMFILTFTFLDHNYSKSCPYHFLSMHKNLWISVYLFIPHVCVCARVMRLLFFPTNKMPKVDNANIVSSCSMIFIIFSSICIICINCYKMGYTGNYWYAQFLDQTIITKQNSCSNHWHGSQADYLRSYSHWDGM